MRVIETSSDVIFKTDVFKIPIKQLDVCYILAPGDKAVVAELVVTKIEPTRELAIAKIARIPPKLNLRTLLNNKVIRSSELERGMMESLYIRENPLLHLGASYSSFLVTSANLVTGASIDAIVNASGIYLETFAPQDKLIRWTNWFGARLSYSRYSGFIKTLRRVQSNSTQEASLSGSRLRTELLVQPWFHHWFYRFHILVGVFNRDVDSIELGESVTKQPATDFFVSSSYVDFGTEIAFQPVPRFYAGIIARFAPAHNFIVNDSSQEGEQGGTLTQTTLGVWAGTLLPLFTGLRLSLRAFSEIRYDVYDETSKLGIGEDAGYVDRGASRFDLGLSYALP